MRHEAGRRDMYTRGCRRRTTWGEGGPRTREDWLDALELVLGSRVEAEEAYEAGIDALRFEEEVRRDIGTLPETEFDA
jgi:hypothetical protein